MDKKSLIGLKEFREHTEEYIDKVRAGKSFIVLKRSRPVFKVAPVDAWGDEGTWETVADFTEVAAGGVRAEDVLQSLQAHGSDL